MKKISMILFAAALTVAFAACSGGKKEEAKTPETPATEVQAPVDSTAQTVAVPQEEDPAEALKAFVAYAKEYAEAHNNIAKDPNKYTKLARQSQQKIADMERLKEKFTKKQLAEYQKAFDIVKKVNSGGK
jgi:ABC-type glycerol-3-phosphate transport system substrate-binding protein